MTTPAGQKPLVVWLLNLSVIALTLLWLFPTLGLFVSSFRTSEQITASGWWSSMFPAEQTVQLRVADPDENRIETEAGIFVVEGTVFGDALAEVEIESWGTSSRAIDAYRPGDTADLGEGETLTLNPDGTYLWRGGDDQISGRAQRLFINATMPPDFTLANYEKVLFDERNSEGMLKAFFNTLTVVIPATIIPILIAAFAAYALAWMDFPGRALLIAAVVGLLVVPLQLALIPLLTFHNAIGIGKGYLGTWMAHTGFGLPLAIYLLRNYMVGLPRDIIENARVDGATEFQIFTKIILPLSFPALASFAIFQFLWTWNDLLVALVFLIDSSGQTTVMTKQIVELLGTRGGDWEILATSAFVSIAVPLAVFFLMQRYLVRGLLAGSVK
ncbi:carbohydrate ABC transporter permease [Thalassorhabdomicrobium marinisediminis]|uniref:Alpha-glucoside ABC transporter permease n=1 Tax=Thalassorhabdomicrobium marinisediminis TaxID=2170577 RepID=A0A2T7FV17_9RHOB|nr:carbohydrate ABC transporter permease [Thalassorhabdomicrobium marinisediminis]PVA05999.1 alpha-glucoside ABC transporter permease [Thalassorhabdomicrobium marinisediminis]